MSKIVKIGGQGTINTLAVEIGSKTYNVPLAGSMKRKELMALKDEESVYEMFARHIPADVLDNLTMDEYNQLAEAWTKANEKKDNASLGES